MVGGAYKSFENARIGGPFLFTARHVGGLNLFLKKHQRAFYQRPIIRRRPIVVLCSVRATMKHMLLTIGLLLVGVVGQAQIKSVLIGINGLTCSQCTRNVEMQLRKLPFVAGVTMNLEQTNGAIQLKDEVSFAPERVVRAVQNAGFSIRYLKLVVLNPAQTDTVRECFAASRLRMQIVDGLPQSLPDTLYLQLLGEPFQPRKAVQKMPRRTCVGSRYFAAVSPENVQ